MHGTPRSKIGGSLKIIGSGDKREVYDGDTLMGRIEKTEHGWKAFRFGGLPVMWSPQRSKPPVARYEKVMKAWSAKSLWREAD